MNDFDEHHGLMPLDVAVDLMARGYDLNELEGHSHDDPYFED